MYELYLSTPGIPDALGGYFETFWVFVICAITILPLKIGPVWYVAFLLGNLCIEVLIKAVIVDPFFLLELGNFYYLMTLVKLLLFCDSLLGNFLTTKHPNQDLSVYRR